MAILFATMRCSGSATEPEVRWYIVDDAYSRLHVNRDPVRARRTWLAAAPIYQQRATQDFREEMARRARMQALAEKFAAASSEADST